MPENVGKKVAAALVGGAVIGAIAGAYLVSRAAEEEERPPIIVRGGSLIFQSGEGTVHGKPWFEDADGEWKQYHDEGRPTRVYDLTFEPQSCQARTAPEFTVVYDPDGSGSAGEQKFEVARRPRKPGGGGTDAPAVLGQELNNVNRRPYPTLTHPGTSAAIIRVEGPGGQVLCANPTKVTAHPKH